MKDYYLAMTVMQRKLLTAKAYLAARGLGYRVDYKGHWKSVVTL